MAFEYQLQQLCQSTVLPTTHLSAADSRRLNVAIRTINQNNHRLAEHVDGDLVTNPIYICSEEAYEESGFDVLRLLHNYLASLYSYNETVRVLFDRYSPEGQTLTSGGLHRPAAVPTHPTTAAN